MRSRREARLRPEYAGEYPYISVGKWQTAAVLADVVVAHALTQSNGPFITGKRALNPAHFEFRGWDANGRFTPSTRREDPLVDQHG
jgi:hypothetical protein